ncbi:MAG: nucleotide exchange factor GrpE [Acidobacteriota bacterium]
MENGKPSISPDEALDAAVKEAVEAVEAVERKSQQAAEVSAADELKAQSFGDEDFDEEGGEVARLEEEIKSLRETSIRTLADFDNYRKRIERERAEMHRYAMVEPMRDFLPIMDNLERALAASSGSSDDLRVGVELIHKQMVDLLNRNKIETVAAVGERFDPNIHEAMMREESDEVEEPTVVEEFQRGYRLHERLVRPAMVKVALPLPRAPEGSADSSSSEAADSATVIEEADGEG